MKSSWVRVGQSHWHIGWLHDDKYEDDIDIAIDGNIDDYYYSSY